MKNFRTVKLWLLILVGYLKRVKLWLLLTLVIGALVIFAQAEFKIFYNPNSITLALIGTYQEHDLPKQVTGLISRSLVKIDDSGHARPNLASGWEVNHDATIFRFKLKKGLKWSDGSPVKAGDLFFEIPNVSETAVGDDTVQFNLKEAYSPFPSLLTKPVLKKGTLLGVGPYQITGIEKSRIFITKINLKPIKGKLPLISVRFYPNEKVAITGFELGEAQALLGFNDTGNLPADSQAALLQKTDYSKLVSILFNTRDSALSNRSMRQALAYSTPEIAGEKEANNPYPPMSWAYDPQSKKYLSNPEEAAAALTRAKVSLSADVLKEEIILTATPNLEEVGNLVTKAWNNLGVDAKLRIESGIPQNFQVLLITQSIPADPDQYVLWHATQTRTNLTRYDSKRVDKDLEDGRKAISEEDRKAKYFDLQKALLEDTPAVFLYFPKYNIAYLKKKEALLKQILALEN